jgi:protease-4
MTGGKKYARLIREIRKKDKVKAIVVRVNSPGGSALASEDIWHELQLASEEGLPVIASMGDLAASGGYYISCGADTIVADPATLTGSIGVVGMIPNMQELMDEKLGIHFDTVLTGPYADGISPFFPIDKQTWSILNNEIDSLYTVFKSRVAKGRSMSMDEVETVAQGRVWAGRDALEVGLVDKMGDLQDAIDIAASKAGVDEYLLVEYPKIKDPLNQLMDMILGNDNNQVRSRVIEAELGEYASYYRHLKELKEMEGVQARLPFFIEFR